MRMPKRMFAIGMIVLATSLLAAWAQEAKQSEREAMYYRYLEFASYVKGGSIEPHWMTDGSSFWYAEGAPDNTVIWKVDPKANTKAPLFDTARLRKAVAPLLGHEPPYQGLLFAEFTFVGEGEKAMKFAVENKEFILRLDSYAITSAPALSPAVNGRRARQVVRKGLFPWLDLREELSPDGRWFASFKDHNLWLHSADDGPSRQITTDGMEDYDWIGQRGEQWEGPWTRWSPDSLKLAVKKVDYRKVSKIPIVHYLKATEEVEWIVYPRRGEARPQVELYIVEILSKRQVRVEIGEERDQEIFIVPGWGPDGSELLFLRKQRFNQWDLLAANAATGSTRVVLSEADINNWWQPEILFTLLEDGKRFLWISERDGWDHLYLYELDGTVIRRLTQGAFPILRVVGVDEKAGWIYFTAVDQQPPYNSCLYRVDLEGKRLTQLTEPIGWHDIEFSASKQFFIDTYSSVDQPPVVELRRADGRVLQVVAKASIDRLKDLKWSPPERFVVKAADGQTHIHGVLYKPYDFDPNKKYPVIEFIHASPGSIVPRTFAGNWWAVSAQAMAQLGFITFIVDGRGTAYRGKQFREVNYQQIGRYEIADHVAALEQLARNRSYMDMNRVGIYGASYGGYMAIRGLLVAPEVYHVGVADAPVADMSERSELALDPPPNLQLAGNLEGKVLLIHGTSDRAAPVVHTMKMVEAFIRAGKSYDLVVLPEQGHSFTGTSEKYAREAARRYFQEHLKP